MAARKTPGTLARRLLSFGAGCALRLGNVIRAKMSNAFVDRGLEPGVPFLAEFLDSSEFRLAELRQLADIKSRNRRELVNDIIERVERKALTASPILAAMVRRDRTWLTVCNVEGGLSLAGPPKLKSATSLLRKFGDEGWHGPVTIGPSAFYIYAYHSVAFEFEPGTKKQVKFPLRWHVVAEVNNNRVAFTWNNHQELPEDAPDEKATSQFPFWREVPRMITEFGDELGRELSFLEFEEMVLHDWWEQYETHPGYRWQHLRIRADNAGVRLNASSRGMKVTEAEVSGLQGLSNTLAEVAMDRTAKHVPSLLHKTTRANLKSAMLRTLIKDWGALSYEFALYRLSDGGDIETADKVFKAHVYFGSRNGTTQDCFPHLRCVLTFGGSRRALNFIIDELETARP